MGDRIETALDVAFPDRTVSETGPTGPSWNEDNETVRVTFADGEEVYLKVAVDDDGSRIARERAVVAFVGATGDVPVPTVLDADPEATVPYLVTKPVDGEMLLGPWDDANLDERADLARRVGVSLARVHERRFERAGHIVGGDADGLTLDTAPWTDVLVDRIEWYREYSPADRFDHHFDAVIDRVEANRDLLDAAPAALLHGDTAKPNCFLAADERVGFLDWEIAHVGDPVRDVNRARGYLDGLRDDGPEAVVEGFFAGYRATTGSLPDGFDERLPVYRAVRQLSWSGFFDNYLQFLEESPEDLATWVEEEMQRRLAAI